uniref:Uncharacterized protein n=1 Tax=Anguilla anguilla TaxID=7936 RepID=A0A0E9XH45_ANGAN
MLKSKTTLQAAEAVIVKHKLIHLPLYCICQEHLEKAQSTSRAQLNGGHTHAVRPPGN